MKTVSAIIVNWNNREAVAACVRSVLDQTGVEVEIIVCDNASTDDSVEFLREHFPGVQIIQNNENLGFGPAVNRGLAVAKGEHLIFLNNDLVLEPDCLWHLSNMVDSSRNLGGVVPKILYNNKPGVLNSFGVDVHYTGMACPHMVNAKDSPNMKPYETACGGIFMFPRFIYEATGGFDPEFFLYHEDHDLSWRIRLLGYRIETCPQAVMGHDYHFSKGVFKFYSSEKNRAMMLIKNYSLRTLILILPALLVVEAAQWVHAATHGWFGLKLKSYLEILAGLPILLRKRKAVQSTRVLHDREIVGLHENRLQISGLQHPWVENWLSPFLENYGERVRRWF